MQIPERFLSGRRMLPGSLFCFLALVAALHAGDAPPQVAELAVPKPDDAISNTLNGTAPPSVQAFPDIFTKGRFTLDARYKFEGLDQDSGPNAPYTGPIHHTGYSSTLRVALGFETAPIYGLTAYGQVAGVYGLGFDENYRVSTVPDQNHAGFPQMNDPRGTQANQYWLDWKTPEEPLEFRFGQEELQLLNGRFIGYSPYRQTHQTADLASVRLTPIDFEGGKLSGRYVYFYQIHKTDSDGATDSPLDMESHLVDLDWALKDRATVTAYALLLDYDVDDYSYAGVSPAVTQSTRTTGIRAEGPWKIDDDWGIHYVADFAHQAGWAGNPNHVSENYWQVEAGPVYRGHHFFVGSTCLGGKSATDLMSTPLAPPLNGWSEFFISTPTLPSRAAYGLDAAYLTATGPIVKGLKYTVTGYDYWASSNGTHYGSELDVGLEYKFAKHYTAGWRLGDYFADQLYTDSVRTSITLGVSF